MDHEFWTERWARGEIGFHRSSPHWALSSHWSAVSGRSAAPVLVPLCGKSLDLHWFRDLGYPVVGVELDPSAVTAFFKEWTRSPVLEVTIELGSDGLVRHAVERIQIHQGDFFAFEPAGLFSHIYDRAALIAMPPAMRRSYLSKLMTLLAPGAQGLLITFEYDQNQIDGPPFSVNYKELVCCDGLTFELLEARDVIGEHPGMQARGLSRLMECVYRISKA